MDTLTIGIVSPEFPPAIGGVERYAYEYVKALVDLGHRVIVLTRPHPEGEIEADGLEIRPCLRRNFNLDRQTVKGIDVDAWHVMNAAYAWIANETAAPVVVSVHGNDFLRPYLPLCEVELPLPARLQPAWLRDHLRERGRERTRKLMLSGLEQARTILTNSHYTEQVLLERYPQLAGRTVVGLVGVSQQHLDTPPRPRADGEPPRLITISRLSEPRKNIHLVIEALAELKDEFEFSYRVIGEGAERASLQALSEHLGLGQRVSFLGRVSEEEMLSELAASDLFVLCSSILTGSHEGFGIVYLEANACGVPTLGARLAGASEAIDEGRSGFFVDEPSVTQIREALRRFLSGAICFEPAACHDFAAEFTWQRVVEKALPFYA